MSDARKFQLNIKFGGGYEAPLLNIEGDSAEEFQANVGFCIDNVVDIVRAATLFQATYNVEKPHDAPPAAAPAAAKSWSGSGSQQAAPAAAAGQPGPPPSCAHGDMKWRPPGISQRTKKAYDGFWACTAPRDQQCAAVNA